MNRGSDIALRKETGTLYHFNEAPIHESGKFFQFCHRSSSFCHFNEAPIHESGKSQAPEGRRRVDPMTSMRPRFMNRGSSPDRVPIRWVHDHTSMRPRFMNRGSSRDAGGKGKGKPNFNEAPIHESGKSNQRVVDGLIEV